MNNNKYTFEEMVADCSQWVSSVEVQNSAPEIPSDDNLQDKFIRSPYNGDDSYEVKFYRLGDYEIMISNYEEFSGQFSDGWLENYEYSHVKVWDLGNGQAMAQSDMVSPYGSR